jgi:transposase
MRVDRFAPARAASTSTPTTRACPSSLTDAEWRVLQPLVERPATPQNGRPPKHPLGQIIDAIRYLVQTGCA